MIRRRARKPSSTDAACSLSGIRLSRGTAVAAYVVAFPVAHPNPVQGALPTVIPVGGPVRFSVGDPASAIRVPPLSEAPLAKVGYVGPPLAQLVHDLARGEPREGVDGAGSPVRLGLWWAMESIYQDTRDAEGIAGGGRPHLAGAERLLELALGWKRSVGKVVAERQVYGLRLSGAASPARIVMAITPDEVAMHPILSYACNDSPSGIGIPVRAITDAVMAEMLTVRIPRPHVPRWGQALAVAAEYLRIDDVLQSLGRTWEGEAGSGATAEVRSHEAFVTIVTPAMSEAMGPPASELFH